MWEASPLNFSPHCRFERFSQFRWYYLQCSYRFCSTVHLYVETGSLVVWRLTSNEPMPAIVDLLNVRQSEFSVHCARNIVMFVEIDGFLAGASRQVPSTLVVQDDIQQRTMDLELAVVLDESHFPESVHEKADSRTSRADHFR